MTTSYFVNIPGDKSWLPALVQFEFTSKNFESTQDLKMASDHNEFSITSESKKPGQNTVVYHYCDLSRFFWLRRYVFGFLLFLAHCTVKYQWCAKRQQYRKNSPYEYQMISWFFSHTYCVCHIVAIIQPKVLWSLQKFWFNTFTSYKRQKYYIHQNFAICDDGWIL